MRIIQLHKVTNDQRRPDSVFNDTDDVGENQNPAQQGIAAANAEADARSNSVAINVDCIRCFYVRRAERGPGTRITFTDGGGFAVTETYDEVLQQIISA